MAEKAADNRTSNKPAGPPVQIIAQRGGGRIETIAIRQLARIVAALPPHQFMPLNDALAQAKSCLGSYRLAAHDLTRYACAKRLTLAVRVIWPDGTEQSFILRSVFWRWHVIMLPDSTRLDVAGVRGPVPLAGYWYFFVGRRRFERLFSTTTPSKPVAQKPPPEPEEWLILIQAEFARVPRKKRSAWVRDTAFPRMQRELRDKAPWDTWQSLKRAMYPGRQKKF